MIKPKLELKKVKTFRGMEGTGLNAELWINGLFCIFVIDDANGGCYNYEEQLYNNPKAKQVMANIKLLDTWIAEQLPHVCKDFGKPFSIKVDRDMVVDELFENLEKEKFEKKRVKRYANSIVYGVPNGKSFGCVSWKGRPLVEIDKITLQRAYNDVKKTLKAGEAIFNTANLEALGINP